MNLGHLLASFGSGLFLCNAVPHLAAGLRGEPFPSPFATPPGRGDSGPVVNVLWGTANLAASALLWSMASFAFGANWATLLFFLGFVLLGVPQAQHFGSVRDSRAGK